MPGSWIKLKKTISMNRKKWLSEEDYNFIYSRAPRLCVDFVIQSKNGILLSKREIEPGKGTWHLPGGRVRMGEGIESAASRIAQSELGIKVRLGSLLGYMEFLKEKQNGRPRHSVSLVFLVRPLSKSFRSSWQAEKIAFHQKLPAKTYYGHRKFLNSQKFFT